MSIVQSTEFRIESARTSGPELTLTSAAAARLAALSAQQGRRLMLRVAVDGGGCSGFQYRFELVEAAEADDLRIETDGRAALVDPVSLPFLVGSAVDFVDDLSGAQFVVRNPNAASSCGCGVSFSI
ncbi:MAG TPA: iron-sulfur cluster insertion protein ErpA [Brevundimonas sp.]|uniref:iron-sulfur cluster insertion protein ErpA n=1 Tax=Brevundimonas sp. TaxID=1871086 RepID=UPI002DE47BF1|nr:iron-sulfur cluster insertion protein ErpA [Brevundimonas sp.]